MYNTMNGVNVADKLGLGPEVRELKFGSSFTSGSSSRSQQPGSFHSVRYDFKPASVDASKMATLDVGPNGQVTISMPNVDGNGTTVFKGARKPYAKECVLIIDNDTGEVVLEKLTHNIQVKRTREEGGSKKGGSMSMPVIPSPSTETKKNPPPPLSYKGDPKMNSRDRDREDSKKMPTSQMQHSHSQHPKRPTSGSSIPPYHQQRQSPNTGSPSVQITSPPSAPQNFSPSVGSSQELHRSSKHSQQQQQSLFSLTNFEDLLSMNPPAAPISKPGHSEKHSKESSSSKHSPMASTKTSNNTGNGKNTAASALSESSSGSSSSSSSSDEDDDDSSDMEEVLDKVPVPLAPESNKSPNLGPSRARPHQPAAAAVAPSMPTDLLCEDLQLSESGSDSD